MKKLLKIIYILSFLFFFMSSEIKAIPDDVQSEYLNTIESYDTLIIPLTKEDMNTENEITNNIDVEVPDTLSTTSALLLSLSMFDIFLGIGILLYVKKYKTQE